MPLKIDPVKIRADRACYDLSCRLHLAVDNKDISLGAALMVFADFMAHHADRFDNQYHATDLRGAARLVAEIAQQL